MCLKSKSGLKFWKDISGNLVVELQENLPASFSMLQSDGLRFSISDEMEGTSIERRYVVRAGGAVRDLPIWRNSV